MTPPHRDLIWGRLFDEAGGLPLTLWARLCDLRPRFLPKGRAGRGYRAVARNGRVLLATELPLAELANHPAHIRIQTWHRAILEADRPEPYGLLVCLLPGNLPAGQPLYVTRLARLSEKSPALVLAVGGGMVLVFSPEGASTSSQ